MKELLLAKSNIRKGKGLAIGLVLLILLASCFLNVMLSIFIDLQNTPYKIAKDLNSEDAAMIVSGKGISKITEEYINSKINKEDVNYFTMTKSITRSVEFKYATGTVSACGIFDTYDKVMNVELGKSEILEEDQSISGSYIYLPYQYHTGGQINVGEDYEIKMKNETYKFKVKGFINNMLSGSANSGTVLLIIDDASYNNMKNNLGETAESLVVRFDLKDGVKQDKFINKLSYTIQEEVSDIYSDTVTMKLDVSIFSRTFIGTILGISCLVVSTIVVTVVLLMLSNSISNYIKDNVKILGAIKAVGFTSRNIKASFVLQFVLLSFIGNILGIAVSYVILPLVAKMLISQSGIPYTVSFNPVCAAITLVSVISVIFLTVLFFVRKIKKIEPITALREGVSTHNFKKNRIKLEKTHLPLHLGLAIKTMFTNIKQNVATFIITFFLIFSAIVALVMYQNFSVKPNLSVLSFEICDGAVWSDKDTNKEIYNYIASLEGVKNVREVTSLHFYNKEARLLVFMVDDTSKIRNQDVCYEGRLPKYDNEIALSGKYCKSEEYNIGDIIELNIGQKAEKYILTGFIQTTNNMGQEGVLTVEGASKIYSEEYNKEYYFDVGEGVNIDDCLTKIKDKFKERINSTVNFEDLIKGYMGIFVTVSNTMAISIIIINAVLILLVLYLLIKTLVNKKKKDYGILKAMGYTSRNIIFQNAISFMPSIILAVISSCIISSIVVNPYLTLIMNLFGIMRVNFAIPIYLIIPFGICFILLSLVFSLLLSLKIRKIEPYNLIKGE